MTKKAVAKTAKDISSDIIAGLPSSHYRRRSLFAGGFE
jgi:hypothetical protein